jgi:hypothetical protein
MPTCRDRLAEKKLERREVFKRDSNDGPVVAWLRSFFGFELLHCWIERYTARRLRKLGQLDESFATKDEADAPIQAAIERYWVVWTIGVVALYSATWCALRQEQSNPLVFPNLRLAAYLISLGFCVYRAIDIVAVDVRLVILQPYRTNNFAHAISLFFLQVVQVVVCFAVFYIVCAQWSGDRFVSDPCELGIWSSIVAPIYFSTTTIATVGFGDLAPQDWPGQCLVVLQIFVGIGLLVVGVQRTLGGELTHKNKK